MEPIKTAGAVLTGGRLPAKLVKLGESAVIAGAGRGEVTGKGPVERAGDTMHITPEP
jgi:hypothetical protein